MEIHAQVQTDDSLFNPEVVYFQNYSKQQATTPLIIIVILGRTVRNRIA